MNKYLIGNDSFIVIENEDFEKMNIALPKRENGEIKNHLAIKSGYDLIDLLIVFKIINENEILEYAKEIGDR